MANQRPNFQTEADLPLGGVPGTRELPQSPAKKNLRGLWSLSIAQMLLTVVLYIPANAQQHSPGAQPNDSQPSPPAAPAADADTPTALATPDLDDPALQRLANELVDHARSDPAATDQLKQALKPTLPARARKAVLTALGAKPSIAVKFIDAIALNLDPADESTSQAALNALASMQDRTACGAVMDQCINRWDELTDPLRQASIRTLIFQTGRDDLEPTPKAWQDWWSAARFLTEPEWRRQVAVHQARRASALEAALEATDAQLVELQREVHRLTPDEQRPALLAQLLRSQHKGIRELGLQLTNRRILNARPIDDAIIAALLDSLNDSDPTLRAAAAGILTTVAPPSSVDSILDALEKESDPLVAAALLRAASKSPTPRLEAISMQWLKNVGPTGDAAVEALLALQDSGHQLNSLTNTRIRTQLVRQLPTLSPAAMRLLVRLGEARRIRPLLDNPEGDIAGAAATALVLDSESVDVLVHAAQTQPTFAAQAIESLARHRSNAAGLALALQIANPDDTEMLSHLISLEQSVPPNELLQLASSTRDADTRVLATELTSTDSFLTDKAAPLARVELALIRIRALLDLTRVEDAIKYLNQLPTTWNGPRVQVLHIEALLKHNQIDEAAAVTAQAINDIRRVTPFLHVWRNAIEHAGDESAASTLASAMLSRFGSDLPAPLRSQCEHLVENITDSTTKSTADPKPSNPDDEDHAVPPDEKSADLSPI